MTGRWPIGRSAATGTRDAQGWDDRARGEWAGPEWNGARVRRAAIFAAATIVACGAEIACSTSAFVPSARADDNYVAFLSPTRNISCEINYHRQGIPDETFCYALSRPESVTLNPDGTFSVCTGESCLANAAQNTPTLGYGQTMTNGPFSCRSEVSGVTCTVASGRGFMISSTAITTVG